MFALSTELNKEGNAARIRSLFERALELKATQHSVLLWRTYLAYEFEINQNIESARRIYFRAIHACPWYIFSGILNIFEIKFSMIKCTMHILGELVAVIVHLLRGID
jgi:hypothetical protein